MQPTPTPDIKAMKVGHPYLPTLSVKMDMVVLFPLARGNKKLAAVAGLSGLNTNDDTLLGASNTKSLGAKEGSATGLRSPRWVDTLPVFFASAWG